MQDIVAFPNLACAFGGCREPVIGQCSGYQKPCGKFYCASHSTQGLCTDCSARKAEDDKIAEFTQIAENLLRERPQVPQSRGEVVWALAALLLLPMSGAVFIGGIVISYRLASLLGQPDPGGLILIVFAATFGLFSIGLITLTLVYFVNSSRIDRLVDAHRMARAEEIDRTQSGFLNFFRKWTENKRGEGAMGGLALVGLATLAAAAAASTETEEQRTRRAVDKELRRHGL